MRGLATTGKDVVVTDEHNVLSIRSERVSQSWGSAAETTLRFVTRLIPDGSEVTLADIIRYAPGTPELSRVLTPAFAKALGGSAKKARRALAELKLATEEPIEPAECLLTPTGVHFVWADRNSRDPSSYPSEEGAVLDFVTLRKMNALNDTGRLASFLRGK